MQRTNLTTWKVALLLFGSGTCALIYQMAWLREFRLIFGASTGASAAVLAIFMGGLGLGSLLLGHRADRQARPLGFYAKLELAIAVSAALTPFLLYAVRQAYIATGGSPVMGLTLATVARLVLSALVLLVPTFLMGGTLPAAARSVEDEQDVGRRHLALLYGANTLGAVTGSAVATFYMVEMFGTHKTLWAACLVNALIALIARALSSAAEGESEAAAGDAEAASPVPVAHRVETAEAEAAAVAPARFVLLASGIVGFAFLLMELVWYRMLSPILGGSTFTFGLILVVALLGIGLGGAAYAVLRSNKTATLTGFGLTCALEAVFLAIPFALGDWLAILAMQLRSLTSLGFWGLVMGWTIVTLIVVLPAAFVSGVQFPLLIALLGRGKAAVGRHVGLAYTYNTIGAIVGSLAGGFGVLPILTAVNTWRVVVVILAMLAAATLALAFGRRREVGYTEEGESGAKVRDSSQWYELAPAAVATVLAVLMILATGPSAAWRHGGIGAGRSDHIQVTQNFLHNFINDHRRWVVKEWDGVESSVALTNQSGFSFYVNGKSDGHIRSDAGTQVMSGILGALIHPKMRTAMIIGLGTGSTAGWLGAVPSVERVDVVELEPAILEIARACADGNQHVLSNPKVHISIGDAREALLTTPNRYDMIFSEPSNPYRSGIASLYTQDFYQACVKRLAPGGLFVQWLQGYEVDGQTVRTVYATLHSVFDHVETWRTQTGDMLLMGSREPIVHDVATMRQRLKEEPFRTAASKIWRVTDAEGVFGHHMGNADFARSVAKAEDIRGGRVNTDDHNFIEFAFARSVGSKGLFNISQLLQLARSRGEERPLVSGDLDWDLVEDRRITSFIMEGTDPPMPPQRPNESQALRDRRYRAAALAHLLRGNNQGMVDNWARQPRPPQDLTELLFMISALNELADARAEPLIEQVRPWQPVEADALMAHLRWRQKRGLEAYDAMESALLQFRRDPWAHMDLMRRSIIFAGDMARGDPTGKLSGRLYNALATPFCLDIHEDIRRKTLVRVATHIDEKLGSRLTIEALAKFEPDVPWDLEFLVNRASAYYKANHPLTMKAAEQVDEYRDKEPFPFELDLAVEPPPATQPTTGPATGPSTAPTSGPTMPAGAPVSSQTDTGSAPGPRATPTEAGTKDTSGRQ
jgi:spermidine synthase